MNWTDDGVATAEYDWLRLMAATKYDGYSDFRAGSRFIENLATWLKQFDPEDRATAYQFVKHRLVYISASEMQQTIEAFYPETVTPFFRRLAAEQVGIAPHELWGSGEGVAAFDRVLRRTLFVGLSDGSRIDILRRANAGRISQEQVVPMMNIGTEKWNDLAKKLREGNADDEKFEHVFLIDDFTASGTTFIRFKDNEWKGKLQKFNKMVCGARGDLKEKFPIVDNYALHIHHYVSTNQAHNTLLERIDRANREWSDRTYGSISITEGTLLPASLALSAERDATMIALCEKYYDHGLYLRLIEHVGEAEQTDLKMGYANCALPLVLEHNTPNNSIPLLWAETAGEQGRAMRPLFRRRDRHG
ncbi:MAG TPA: hypothetical protein VFW19_08745 [Allosphingosinicella sp.]|nr:hypothetical protein [Allosphingosinicella sp.]